MYVNVKNAYDAPTLGKSDHNLIHLRTSYKPWVMRMPKVSRSFRQWTPQACDALRDCFESTDWKTLLDSGGDISEAVDCVTDYINFCTDVAVLKRTVHCFPNNIPWIKNDNKQILNLKKQALKLVIGTR